MHGYLRMYCMSDTILPVSLSSVLSISTFLDKSSCFNLSNIDALSSCFRKATRSYGLFMLNTESIWKNKNRPHCVKRLNWNRAQKSNGSVPMIYFVPTCICKWGVKIVFPDFLYHLSYKYNRKSSPEAGQYMTEGSYWQ